MGWAVSAAWYLAEPWISKSCRIAASSAETAATAFADLNRNRALKMVLTFPLQIRIERVRPSPASMYPELGRPEADVIKVCNGSEFRAPKRGDGVQW